MVVLVVVLDVDVVNIYGMCTRGVQNTKKNWYDFAPKLIPFLWQILAHMPKISPLGALEGPAHDTPLIKG